MRMRIYSQVMSTMAYIRKQVFGVTQGAFAEIAGTTQGTVSRWEAGELEPTREQLERVRGEAISRGLEWEDSWFFERPAEQSHISPEAAA